MNPELKHPWNYTSQELTELMFKPLRFHVGRLNSDQVEKIVEGEIIQLILASNPPYLPADLIIRSSRYEKERYCILEVKAFSHIVDEKS